MDEVTQIINEVDSNPAIEAAVIISGKPGVFIAGADITMIENCKTQEEVVTLSKRGIKVIFSVCFCYQLSKEKISKCSGAHYYYCIPLF